VIAVLVELCLRCGAKMEWRHQTWQCRRCGFKLGCCEGECPNDRE
jgi:exosome complex RNA-binding protein Csl4